MGMGDIKGNGQPKTSSRFIQIARMIQPHKGPERIIAVLLRNARPIIVDKNGEQRSSIPPFTFTCFRSAWHWSQGW